MRSGCLKDTGPKIKVGVARLTRRGCLDLLAILVRCHRIGRCNHGLIWHIVERVKGIEPSPKAWEAFVLPLNYTRNLDHVRKEIGVGNFIAQNQGGGNSGLETRTNANAIIPSRPAADRVNFSATNPGDAMELWALACLAVLATGLGVLAVVDLRTGYLPDPAQIALAMAGMAVAMVASPVGTTWQLALLGAIINGGVFWGLRWLVSRFKGREAMGLGDVKLVAVGGLWLGPWALPYIMAIGGVLTLAGAGAVALATQKPVWRGEMPLGPGLAAGILAAYIGGLMGFPLLHP